MREELNKLIFYVHAAGGKRFKFEDKPSFFSLSGCSTTVHLLDHRHFHVLDVVVIGQIKMLGRVGYDYRNGFNIVHARVANSINMSLRKKCKETSKQPSKALLYFPQEMTTGIAPTWLIDKSFGIQKKGV